MKVFYITLKGGMREVARFMTDYLAAYDYSEFEVKHDFSGYPVIIFEPHFEDDDIDIEVAEVIQSDLHFDVITYGMCEQEELKFNTPYYSDYSKTSLAYKVNHLKVEFSEFCSSYCSSHPCEECKYKGLSDCRLAFALDKKDNTPISVSDFVLDNLINYFIGVSDKPIKNSDIAEALKELQYRRTHS